MEALGGRGVLLPTVTGSECEYGGEQGEPAA
jgi:hypothetical protein